MTTQPTPAFPAGWLNQEQYHPEQHLSKARKTSEKDDYLKVAERLVWFIREQRQMIAAGLATTTFVLKAEAVEIDYEHGFAVFRAYARDVLGNESIEIGSESRTDFVDWIEKAATKAKGRALASLGYGTMHAPELDEGERIADAPREQRAQAAKASTARPAQATNPGEPIRRPAPVQKPRDAEAPANEQQLQSLRKLCAALGREEPAEGVLTFSGAAALIRQLAKEHNDRRRSA